MLPAGDMDEVELKFHLIHVIHLFSKFAVVLSSSYVLVVVGYSHHLFMVRFRARYFMRNLGWKFD